MATRMNVVDRERMPDERGGPGDPAAAIARAAARLFALRGFDAASVREIAEAVGVTKPTLYYHFGSKQGLGEAVLVRPVREFLARLAREAELGGGLDPLAGLRGVVRAHLDFVADDPDRSRFLYSVCFGPAGTSFGGLIEDLGEGVDGSLLACCRGLAVRGVIDPSMVDRCARACRGLLMTSTLETIFRGRAIEEGAAEQLVADLLEGFGSPEHRRGRPTADKGTRP